MQIDIDPQADAVYIQLRHGDVDHTLQVGRYIYADVDKDGLPLGIEILFAGRILVENDVTSVTVNIQRPADTTTTPLAT